MFLYYDTVDEMGSSRSRASEDTNFFPEVKIQEDVVSSLDSSSPFKEPSPRTKPGSDKEVQFTLHAIPSSGTQDSLSLTTRSI